MLCKNPCLTKRTEIYENKVIIKKPKKHINPLLINLLFNLIKEAKAKEYPTKDIKKKIKIKNKNKNIHYI